VNGKVICCKIAPGVSRVRLSENISVTAVNMLMRSSSQLGACWIRDTDYFCQSAKIFMFEEIGFMFISLGKLLHIE